MRSTDRTMDNEVFEAGLAFPRSAMMETNSCGHCMNSGRQVVPLPHHQHQFGPYSPITYHHPFGCMQPPTQSPSSSHYFSQFPPHSPLLQSSLNHTHCHLQSPNHSHYLSHAHNSMISSSTTHFHSPSLAYFHHSSSTPLLSPIPTRMSTRRAINTKENVNTQQVTEVHERYNLEEWSLKIVENCLVANGITSGKRKHSGRVARVHPPRTLVTASGSVYTLSGPPSVLLKYSFNLSDKDFQLFSDGLPDRWRSLIAHKRIDLINEDKISDNDSISDNEEPLVTKRKNTKRNRRNNVLDKSSHSAMVTVTDNMVVSTPHTTDISVRSSTPRLQDFSILASSVSVKSERNRSFLRSVTPVPRSKQKVKVSSASLSTPRLTYNQSFLSSLKRSSSGRLLKPVTHRLTDKFLSYSYSTNGELLGLNCSPVIDLTSPSKLDLPKQANKKVIVDPLVHNMTMIQPKDLGPSKDNMSAVSTAQQTERVEHDCHGNKQSNWSSVLVKPKRRKKRKQVRYYRPKKTKIPDAIKNEKTLNNVAMQTSDGGEGMKEDVPLVTESPCQPVNWTHGDNLKLSRAITSLPVTSENFWELVSKQFDGKFTANECQGHYMEMGTRPTRQLRKRGGKTTSSAPEGGIITGRVGTIKRKKQLRNALKAIDSGYHDNLFDSTPIQKKMRHVLIQCPKKSEQFSLEKGEEDVAAVGSNGYKERLEGPLSHTPQLNHYLSADDLDTWIESPTADRVVYRYHNTNQRGLRNRNRHPAKSTTTVPLVNKGSRTVNARDLVGIRSGQHSLFKLFSDNEDDSSEDDEEFTDKIEEKCKLVLGYLD